MPRTSRLAALFFALAASCLLALTTYKPDFGSIDGTITVEAQFGNAKSLALKKLDDETPYLELRRGAMHPHVELARPVGDRDDFGYSFTYTRLQEDSSACFGFKTDKEEFSGLLWVRPNGQVCINNSQGTYESVGLTIGANAATRISVNVSRQTARATIRIGDKAPYECEVAIPEAPLCAFIFSPQAPDGNRSAVSDFELHYGTARILTRQNIALESVCSLEPNPTLANVTAPLADLDLEAEVVLPEKCELLYTLPHPAIVTAVQLFGGRPGVAFYPSGACSPKHYVVEGFADGAWKTLAEVADAPEVCLDDALAPEAQFVLTEFPPVLIEKLRLRFIESHDTGYRMSGPLEDPAKRCMHLREVQIFTDQKAAPPRTIRELVKCDWRLPFYRNADAASLYMEVAENEPPVESIHMEIASPDGQVVRVEDIPVHVGVNVHEVRGLSGWEPGRYMTTLSIAGGSSCRRMLRLERVPEVAPAAEPMPMGAGRKLFFTPDDYLLSECANLAVEVFPVKEFHLLGTTPKDGDWMITYGDQLYPTKDGRYALLQQYRSFKGGDMRHRWLVGDSPVGPFTPVEKAPPRAPQPPVTQDYIRTDFRDYPAGTKLTVFDPATDGEIDLATMRFKYIYNKTDFGCLVTDKPAFWTYARTKEGKWVLTKDRALFEHFVTFGEDRFDTGFDCNDNFGGFWLSQDGKTVYLAQGQTVRRCAPFAVPYDNFPLGLRIMTVYSSQDGVEWKYENTLVPTGEGDSFGAQHYGALRLPFAQGDLVLMYVYNYDADAQQIYIDLAYSRDNVHFHRFPNAPAFARGKDPTSWFYGHIFANNLFRVGDKFYHQAHYCTPLPHFVHEAYLHHNSLQEVEAQDFERAFKRRTLAERWPFFKAVGGYEGLAKMTREGYYANGVMEFRAFGWFGLKAGAGEGRFTTRRMTGGRRLTANAECGPGGYVEIEAVDAATGRRLAVARIDGDGSEQPLFMLPPTQEYFLRGRLKSAVLYTIDFAE